MKLPFKTQAAPNIGIRLLCLTRKYVQFNRIQETDSNHVTRTPSCRTMTAIHTLFSEIYPIRSISKVFSYHIFALILRIIIIQNCIKQSERALTTTRWTIAPSWSRSTMSTCKESTRDSICYKFGIGMDFWCLKSLFRVSLQFRTNYSNFR